MKIFSSYDILINQNSPKKILIKYLFFGTNVLIILFVKQMFGQLKRGGLMKNSLKKIYHYFFDYDEDKLSIYSQYYYEILTDLNSALLHRSYVLVSYQDGTSEIGQIIKRISAGRFILRLENKKLIKIVDIDTIFRVDFA